MGVKGKGAGVSGGVPLAGVRGRAPSTLPRAVFARGIQKSSAALVDPPFSKWFLSPMMAPPPRVVWHPRGRRHGAPGPFRLHHGWLHGPLRNLLPAQLLTPIMNLYSPVFPFAHHHRALGRRVQPALSLYLIEPIVVPHLPIVPEHSPGLQPEDLPALLCRRRVQVIIHRRARLDGEAPVVFVAILRLEIPVHFLMRRHLLASQLLHQPVLMRPVVALYTTLGLWGTGRNDLDSQPLAHAPKLRPGGLSVQQFLGRGLAHVHVFPIRIQRLRHSILLHPGRHHSRRSPDRFLLSHPAQRGRRPPGSSSSLAVPALPANRGSCLPTAPIPRSAPSVLAAAGVLS